MADLKQIVEGKTFGPTASYHQDYMDIIWGPAANLAIILALYTYRKIWIWVHGMFFLFATIFTLSTAIPILTFAGIIPANSTVQYDFPASILNLHQIIGICCLAAITVTSLLGISTKLANLFNAKTTVLLFLRKIHKILGYLIVILCKVNLYIISFSEEFNPLVIADVLTIAIIVVWKLYFPRMQAKNAVYDPQQLIPKIRSLKILSTQKNYVVFVNYVYDIQPLKISHPAGFQIINAVKNKEVDRYIYGSCTVDQLTGVPLCSHSYKSFTLLNKPIAKIEILPTFEGFEQTEVECLVPQAKPISANSNIYLIDLVKKYGESFRFTKYRQKTQLGRYYSLSINRQFRRLYTAVNFLVAENVSFLAKRLDLPSHILDRTETIRKCNQSQGGNSMESLQTKRTKNVKSIPLMFKRYSNGKLTQSLVSGTVNQIHLSECKGQGLQLASTNPGRIIMVVGGTGIFPFSDLIDLLYKEQLILEQPTVRQEAKSLSPILENNPFELFKFQMLAAFNSIEEIHEITLKQLLYLAQRDRMKIRFRFKQDPRSLVKAGRNVEFVVRGFQELISNQIEMGEQVSKIWICGPPKMNQNMSRFLKQHYPGRDLYLII